MYATLNEHTPIIIYQSESVFGGNGWATLETFDRTEVYAHLYFGADGDARTDIPPNLRLGDEHKPRLAGRVEQVRARVVDVGVALVPKIGETSECKAIFPPTDAPNCRQLERGRLFAHDVFVECFQIVSARVVLAVQKVVEAHQKGVVDAQTAAIDHKKSAVVLQLHAYRHLFRERKTARHLGIGQPGIAVCAVCNRCFRLEIVVDIDKNIGVAYLVGFKHFEGSGNIVAPRSKVVMHLKILRCKKKWREAKKQKNAFFRKKYSFHCVLVKVLLHNWCAKFTI